MDFIKMTTEEKIRSIIAQFKNFPLWSKVAIFIFLCVLVGAGYLYFTADAREVQNLSKIEIENQMDAMNIAKVGETLSNGNPSEIQYEYTITDVKIDNTWWSITGFVEYKLVIKRNGSPDVQKECWLGWKKTGDTWALDKSGVLSTARTSDTQNNSVSYTPPTEDPKVWYSVPLDNTGLPHYTVGFLKKDSVEEISPPNDQTVTKSDGTTTPLYKNDGNDHTYTFWLKAEKGPNWQQAAGMWRYQGKDIAYSMLKSAIAPNTKAVAELEQDLYLTDGTKIVASIYDPAQNNGYYKFKSIEPGSAGDLTENIISTKQYLDISSIDKVSTSNSTPSPAVRPYPATDIENNPHWITDSQTGALIFDPSPNPGETVVWHGSTTQYAGHTYAYGAGKATWCVNGNFEQSDEGMLYYGLRDGKIKQVMADGRVLLSQWNKGVKVQ